MTDATSAVPPGWHDDPADSANLRWWDGTGWTAHVAPKPTTAPAPPTGFEPVADPLAAQLQREATYVPFQNAEPYSVGMAPQAAGAWGSPHTLAGWLLGTSLFWASILNLLTTYIQRLVGGAEFVSIVGLVVVVAILILLGVADQRQLRARGFDRAPSPAWIVLSPLAYLIARVVRVGRRSVGPLLTYAIPLALAIVAAIAIPILIAATRQY
jgi:hypothetical protein